MINDKKNDTIRCCHFFERTDLMFIRRASIKDVDAIHNLIVTNLTQVNVQDYSDDVISFMIQYYNTTQLEKWILEKRIFLVAISDDALVGTVM